MHERARFPVLLAALLLSLPVHGEPVPWQLHGPADVKCDQSGEKERQRFWATADWGAVPGWRERMVEYCSQNAPLSDALTAEEVGRAAAFLASPLASGITGTTVYVDKGYHSMGMAVSMLNLDMNP